MSPKFALCQLIKERCHGSMIYVKWPVLKKDFKTQGQGEAAVLES